MKKSKRNPGFLMGSRALDTAAEKLRSDRARLPKWRFIKRRELGIKAFAFHQAASFLRVAARAGKGSE